jgi:molybdopterin/thiamine biosynthesis adenylyltransferase
MREQPRRIVVALRGDVDLPDGRTILSASLVRQGFDLMALVSHHDSGEATVSLEVRSGRVELATISVDGSAIAVDHVRFAGPRYNFTTLSSTSPDDGRFDRQERVFGSAGQRVLSALHVGVVGAGGTGSAVIEQFARIGVGRLTVIDDDVVTETNLTRIHESNTGDVGTAKCKVAGRLARNLGVDYRAVDGRVTDREVARELRICDIVIGCTDDHAGRIVLARMAPRYLQLLIDIGVTVDVVDGRVVGAPCRVSVQEPGDVCLVCRGHVSLTHASAELLTDEDRRSRAGEGYVPGLGEPDPSVVAYTTLAASTAVAEMLSRLFGFTSASTRDLLVDPIAGRWLSLDRPAAVVDGCTSYEVIGSGDKEPFLGMAW